MGLLEKLMKNIAKERGKIHSPATGRLMPLTSIPDVSFASGMLGKGCGIDPEEDVIVAPIDGTLVAVAQTLHAVGIETDDGAELLVHVGMDTVNMNGRGFKALAKQGERVHTGQKLLQFSREEIEKDGLSPIICCVVSNSKDLTNVEFNCEGRAERGDRIGSYEI